MKKVQTIEFLMENGQARSNREFYSCLKEKLGYYSQQRNFGKCLMLALRSLVSPTRIIFILIMIYVIFAALYTLPILQFKVSNELTQELTQGLDIGDSLYFSGITLLTIGYGDIVPIGVARIFSILEGLGGVAIAGGFLLSLVRKYLE